MKRAYTSVADGYDHLEQAVVRGDQDEVRRLLQDESIDVNRTSEDGTLLMHACGPHFPYPANAIAEMLIGAGLDVNARSTDGTTALHLAALHDRHGAVTRLLIHHQAAIDARDEEDLTPLMKAVLARNVRGVSLLLEAGADVRARSNEDRSALSYLCYAWDPGKI